MEKQFFLRSFYIICKVCVRYYEFNKYLLFSLGSVVCLSGCVGNQKFGLQFYARWFLMIAGIRVLRVSICDYSYLFNFFSFVRDIVLTSCTEVSFTYYLLNTQ